MTLRRIAFVTLLLLVAGHTSAATKEMLVSFTDGAPAGHDEKLPCRNQDEDGIPCGAACACMYCAGNVAVAAPRVGLRPPTSGELGTPAGDEPQVEDIHHRIFHPPRY